MKHNIFQCSQTNRSHPMLLQTHFLCSHMIQLQMSFSSGHIKHLFKSFATSEVDLFFLKVAQPHKVLAFTAKAVVSSHLSLSLLDVHPDQSLAITDTCYLSKQAFLTRVLCCQYSFQTPRYSPPPSSVPAAPIQPGTVQRAGVKR